MIKNLVSSFPFSPTPNQKIALEGIRAFLNAVNPFQIFLLKGYAGTGKTSVLAHVSKELRVSKEVILLAPTGRSAKVLSSYCQHPAYTIHKKIYLVATSTEGETKVFLAPNKHQDAVFIIDEASMVSSAVYGGRDLLEDVVRFVYRGKNCRLIIAGDNAQLPPVELDFSPALNSEYLESKFKFPVKEVVLTEVVRQKKGSGILLNATQIRVNLLQGDYKIKFDQTLKDLKRISGVELQECLEQAFSTHGLEETLFVTRSNKSANRLNQEIRNRILYREEEIEIGDVLMAVKNNYFWLANNNNETKGSFIANGESLIVKRILGRQFLYGYHFADVELGILDSEDYDFTAKIWMDSISINTASMPLADERNLFHLVRQEYVDLGEKGVLKKTKDNPFVNALQVKFSYAVTCHKSQGGQWETVFIDHGFIEEEAIDLNFLRWMYTALTRAKTQVYLVNFKEMFF